MSDPTSEPANDPRAEQAVDAQFEQWRTPALEGQAGEDGKGDPRAERVVHVSQRFGVPYAGVDFEHLSTESVPLVGWVIHELKRPTETSRYVWAWCRVTADKPGYDEIAFTTDDGSTVADPGKDFQLGKVITKVWC